MKAIKIPLKEKEKGAIASGAWAVFGSMMEVGSVFNKLQNWSHGVLAAHGCISVSGKKFYFCKYGLIDDPEIYEVKKLNEKKLKMKKSTITDLPNDIRKAVPHFKENEVIMEIITQAQAGEFHDFKNTTHVCGKMAVVEMLQQAGEPLLNPIRQAVIDGEYDESPDAEDKARMKKDWLDDGGTEESYNQMFGE